MTKDSNVTTTDYSGSYVYQEGDLQFIFTPEGYVTPNGSNYDYIYQYKDHLGNNRLSYIDSDGNGSISQSEIIEENNYYPFGVEHKGYNNQINGVENNYLTYQGKEHEKSLGLEWYDFGARNYDGALGRWMNIDPLAESFSEYSPYNAMMNNPVMFIDPDGMAAYSPIYDTEGTFLGTDDEGLQGKAIVMDAENFEQGMSHEDALKNSKGVEGLVSAEAGSELLSHYNGLKDRPDYDGELTLSEANDWYRNGNAEPLFVDLAKVDLDFISSGDFEGVGDTRAFQTLFSSDDGRVYGNITLTNEGDGAVSALPDTYNFERHNKRSTSNSILTRIKENAKRGVRNAATLAGRMYADRSPFNLHNKPFKINFYGNGKISD